MNTIERNEIKDPFTDDTPSIRLHVIDESKICTEACEG
jgi:hypothetical protein